MLDQWLVFCMPFDFIVSVTHFLLHFTIISFCKGLEIKTKTPGLFPQTVGECCPEI